MRFSVYFCQEVTRLGDVQLTKHVQEGNVFLVAHLLQAESSWYEGFEPATVARFFQRENGLLILIRNLKAVPERRRTFYEEFYLTSLFTPWIIANYIKEGQESRLFNLAVRLRQEEQERQNLLALWRNEVGGRTLQKPTPPSQKVAVDETLRIYRASPEDLVIVSETLFEGGKVTEPMPEEDTELFSNQILAAAQADQRKKD